MVSAEELTEQINAQGLKVRELKTAKADKAQVDEAVKGLLALKVQFKEVTGNDFAAPPAAVAPTEKKAKKEEKKPEAKSEAKPVVQEAKDKEEAAPAKKAKKEDKKAKKSTEDASATSNAALVDKLVVYLGANAQDNLKIALAVHLSKVEVVFRPEPSGPVQLAVRYPALVQQSAGLMVFGANAVAKYLLRNEQGGCPASGTDLLALEELVLAPLLRGSPSAADVSAVLNSMSSIVCAWAPLPYLLHPTLQGIDLSGHPSLAALMGQVSKDVLTAAQVLLAPKASGYPAPPMAVLPLLTAADGLTSSIRSIFTAVLQAVYGAYALGDGLIGNVNRCANAAHGDFQVNNAMGLSKALKSIEGYSGPTAPKDIAAYLLQALPPHPLIQSASAAPNGYINIFLSPSTLTDALSAIVTKGIAPPVVPARRVLVDFSSPNIAKEMHVGHLRSTILGDCIAKVCEFSGYDVLRVNHVGDWGTQFGMLITYLTEAYPDPTEVLGMDMTSLTAIYKASKKRFDEDPAFKERSRLNVVSLQAHDPVCVNIWKILCEMSRREFQKVYSALDVHLEEVGESFYNPFIPAAIDELSALGLLVEDQGMQVVKLPHFTIPLILRKSDGGYGYDSTDMAALKYRLFTRDRDWIIIITDAGQATHFHMCFDAGEAAGWVQQDRDVLRSSTPLVSKEQTKKSARLDHIGFGVICGDDGKRFKTRSSETVRLMDLLDEAVVRMQEILTERVKEGKSSLTLEDIPHAARCIGYGAVKYFDLKQHPSTNYIFSYDRMLDTKGDTAVYLMFAYARLVSILRKAADAGKHLETFASSAVVLDHPAERALAFELLQFGDIIKSILTDLLPNRLCDYLKEISVKFTDFVTKCHVLSAPQGVLESRLVLCEATRRAMEKCFYLLGIKPLDRI